jgi:hypothetical protein
MFFQNRVNKWTAAGAATLVVVAGTAGIIGATSSGDTSAATAATHAQVASGGPAGSARFGGGGSNARSGPAAGGSLGNVTNVSASGFTLTTSADQKVTVQETASTAYTKGTSPASASAVTSGQPVLVLGTVSSATIAASQITVQPPSGPSAPSWAGQVIPFTRGAQSAAKNAGQIPSDYKQGSGTLVKGNAANKATKAALAVYPGGIVDRVVRLSNGEYEVHNIGVNWPHHIFVSHTFKVVGAK